jgi:hypothetical protein
VVLLGAVEIGRVLVGVATERAGGLIAGGLRTGGDELGVLEALRDLYLGKRL